MTDLDPESVAFLARIDQQHAGATELARVLANQWKIYREAGMPKATATSLVEMYLEAVVAQEEAVE